MFSFLFRAPRRALSLFMAAAIVTGPTTSVAQDQPIEILPRASYSYQPLEGTRRTDFNLDALAAEFAELQYDQSDLFAIDGSDGIEGLASDAGLQGLRNSNDPAMQALVAGLELGGLSAASAITIGSVAIIGAIECAKLGKVIDGLPILGRSSMEAVQWARSEATGKGLGRGQFDIRTTKFVLCRDADSVDGIAINVRWVFNVNNHALIERRPPFESTPGNIDYKQNFRASGKDIELVLLEINGEPVPEQSPIYIPVEIACIDIWFKEPVEENTISIPASLPNAGVFCAGGYCKLNPPGLDATQ